MYSEQSSPVIKNSPVYVTGNYIQLQAVEGEKGHPAFRVARIITKRKDK